MHFTLKAHKAFSLSLRIPQWGKGAYPVTLFTDAPHEVLLAALARAEGSPSRVVAGSVYYQKAFVGHMWTEVYVGKWVPLDATRSDPRVGADHIAFSVSSLDSGSLAELFLSLVQVIGNLSVDVREVE